MSDDKVTVTQTAVDDAFDLFNERKGRLRVSLTTACQCVCSFCHKEGNDTSGEVNEIATPTYKNLVGTYSELGGREINDTGGEPLLHRDIKDIIKFNDRFDFHRTISTNGLTLDQLFDSDAEQASLSHEFKISLHSLVQETCRGVMGMQYDVEHVMANILEAKKRGFNIIINLTLGDYNQDDVYGVIDFVLRNGLNIKINDLGKTDDQAIDFDSSYVCLGEVIEHLEGIAQFQRYISKNMGNSLYFFTVGHSNILVKDMTVGKYATQMCEDCEREQLCSEGVFALRYTTTDEFKPCLLRDDFNLRVLDYCDNPEEADFTKLLPLAVYKMITGETRRILLPK